jgi:hypothetical protein
MSAVTHTLEETTLGVRMKKLILAAAAALTILVSAFAAVPASARDSVRLPGQVPVEQCPEGFRAATGLVVDVSAHLEYTDCYGPLSAEELLAQEQDRAHWAAIQAAQAAAEAESREWNIAHPGQQKCVQWGPIVHANGVSASSGGVCANPVPATSAVPSVDSTDPGLPVPSTDAVEPPTTPTPSPVATPAPEPVPLPDSGDGIEAPVIPVESVTPIAIVDPAPLEGDVPELVIFDEPIAKADPLGFTFPNGYLYESKVQGLYYC